MRKKGKIKKIEVSERELETLLINDLSVIDENLMFLGNQIQTDSGPLDILALDKVDNSLGLIELKVKPDDEQLFQAIRYYDWVRSRIEWINSSYRKEIGRDIDIKADPWIILVAPDFSEKLKKVARYVDVPLELYEYTVLEFPNKEKYVFCKDIDYGEPYESVEIPTIQGHLDYISDEEVRNLCSEVFSQLQDIGINFQPRKGFINLLRKGDRIGKVRCKRTFFKIKTSFKGEWTDYYDIYTKRDWNSFYEKEIKPFL